MTSKFDGVLLPAGTMVISNTAAANRYPAIYNDPSRCDITRRGLPPILTFGGGTPPDRVQRVDATLASVS
jgi:cytochrome P450